MEAVWLDFYADASRRQVVGVARVTTMAVGGDDVDHDDADGTHRILAVTAAIAGRLGPTRHDNGGR